MPADQKYSHRSLPQKLGMKAGLRVLIVNEPQPDTIPRADIPDGVELATRASGSIDILVIFALQMRELTSGLDKRIALLPQDGMLWSCWPKKSAKLATNVNRDSVFALLVPLGFVDVKVASVDDTWTAMKWVYRKEDRGY